jgi:hypothetical protein
MQMAALFLISALLLSISVQAQTFSIDTSRVLFTTSPSYLSVGLDSVCALSSSIIFP